MSWHGRQCVAHIDARERQEQERLDRLKWEHYRDRLHPDEIESVRGGKRATFSRPVPPPWSDGTWLEAGPKMRVQIKAVRFIRRGVYLIVLSRIEDFRGGGRLTNRPLRELQANESTTIDPISAYEPEPEKVPAHLVDSLGYNAIAQARYEREMAEKRVALNDEPIADRMRRILDAQANGANVGREVRAIHGMLSRAERKIGVRRAA